MQPPPLFPPTTLIVGDSIVRGIRFFNAITRSFPGATVADITAKLPGLLQSLPASIHRIIVHVGTNDTAHQQSELTKNDFRTLLDILQCSGKISPQLLHSNNYNYWTLPLKSHASKQKDKKSNKPPLPSPCLSAHPTAHSTSFHSTKPPPTPPPPPRYSYLHQPRLTGRGGSVAVIHKPTLKTTPVPTLSVHSFENISVKIPGPTTLVIVTIYRPPKPHPSFLSDFSDFFTHLSTISSSVLLLGDFNFHIDNPTCKQATDSWICLTPSTSPSTYTPPPTPTATPLTSSVPPASPSTISQPSTSIYLPTWLSLSTSPPPPTSQ
ncbi:LOW QUALITY PROTEIN: uncharacterized protein LOC116399339 [Xyrichtys novacula]|uniref:LOW QUALITY PROTEIN: uncharacterized protein LOC116399339 n=1 Tax=Xyrichtys novacula TaxID=13765 RepID=A0AAV1F2R7_XYRNO|nr:LOW QUALITY PROTEIN: uncharacterized protein LOC116399339 [Xyrichtys novacula]